MVGRLRRVDMEAEDTGVEPSNYALRWLNERLPIRLIAIAPMPSVAVRGKAGQTVLSPLRRIDRSAHVALDAAAEIARGDLEEAIEQPLAFSIAED